MKFPEYFVFCEGFLLAAFINAQYQYSERVTYHSIRTTPLLYCRETAIRLERGHPARLCALRNQTSLEGTPKRLGVQFQLVRFYYARGRRDARVPVRAASRLLSECRQTESGLINRYVLAIQLSACADVTARRSVTHLTFANMSWRSVPTCSVLLRTEAGETPAFQSAASRKFVCRSIHKRFT
jgi:hypothetical protein